MVYDIRDFGALAVEDKINTAEIQAAIDECHKNGGGRVLVPAGTFVTGTIYLKSNVELHLEMGATLLASLNFEDYNTLDAYPYNYGNAEREFWDYRHLIIAYNTENVAITGLGTIDGRGRDIFGECKKCEGFKAYIWSYGFALQKDISVARPGPTVVFVSSKNIKINDIAINHSPCYCLLLQDCEDVQIRGYRSFNERFWANTDGMHIDSCKNVTISDCIIDAGDDAIALQCAQPNRNEGNDTCENITITNCVLASSSSVIRAVGCGHGKIRNVTISNIIMHRGAKAFNITTTYTNFGHCLIDNIYINNIIANNVSFPFYMRENNDCHIRNVTISNYRTSSVAGAFIISQTGGKIENVLIENMTLNIIPAPFPCTPEDLQADCKYLKAKNGRNVFYIDGANGVEFRNVKTHIPQELKDNWDDVFYLENTQNIIK